MTSLAYESFYSFTTSIFGVPSGPGFRPSIGAPALGRRMSKGIKALTKLCPRLSFSDKAVKTSLNFGYMPLANVTDFGGVTNSLAETTGVGRTAGRGSAGGAIMSLVASGLGTVWYFETNIGSLSYRISYVSAIACRGDLVNAARFWGLDSERASILGAFPPWL